MAYIRKLSLFVVLGGLLFWGAGGAVAQVEERAPWEIGESNDVVNPLGAGGALPINGAMPSLQGGFVPPSPEEIQMQMQVDTEEQKNEAREQAFKAALQSLMPLTPEEIRKTLDAFRINREAAEQPVTVPEPKIYVGNVSLDPEAKPLVVETSPGYVTTFMIVDITGTPWPIQDISWAGDFEVVPPEEGGNIIRITPLTAHGKGNMSIRLVDLRTPITFTMNTQLEIVHYRFEAHVPEDGPMFESPIVEAGGIKTVAYGSELMRYLDGNVPEDAESLFVDGVDGRTRAWRMGEKVVLRTPLTLLSPGWDNSISSADGTRVYSLNEAPVLLLSDRGKMMQVYLSAGETSNE